MQKRFNLILIYLSEAQWLTTWACSNKLALLPCFWLYLSFFFLSFPICYILLQVLIDLGDANNKKNPAICYLRVP